VTTRTDPHLPLLRMRARGELLELRTNELSFKLDETSELFSKQYQLALHEGDLREIQDWAEGWPVGLMLIGQRMQGQNPREREALLGLLTDDVRFVREYLWQEAIEQQSPEQRQFLLQTSVLDRFDADLCAEVTGLPNARAMLSELERENLFLIGLDEDGRWFRYHHLFADVLRERLARDYPAAVVRALHRSAACWYLEHGTIEEAARHARCWSASARSSSPRSGSRPCGSGWSRCQPMCCNSHLACAAGLPGHWCGMGMYRER
jgi:LuxR family maltose regulon positive regulatory protein